jgi:hypothetical protein
VKGTSSTGLGLYSTIVKNRKKRRTSKPIPTIAAAGIMQYKILRFMIVF